MKFIKFGMLSYIVYIICNIQYVFLMFFCVHKFYVSMCIVNCIYMCMYIVQCSIHVFVYCVVQYTCVCVLCGAVYMCLCIVWCSIHYTQKCWNFPCKVTKMGIMDVTLPTYLAGGLWQLAVVVCILYSTQESKPSFVNFRESTTNLAKFRNST